jgi:peptidyl-prolyl cis-trans isomerase A (cyclophilin A)
MRALPVLVLASFLSGASVSACRQQPPAPAAAPAPATEQAQAPAVTPAAAAPQPAVAAAPSQPGAPQALPDVMDTVRAIQRQVAAGQANLLSEFFSAGMKKRVPMLKQQDAEQVFGPGLGAPVVTGGRAVIPRSGPGRPPALVFLWEEGAWRFDVELSMRWLEPRAGASDPLNQPLSLEQALDGLAGSGPGLNALIKTDLGDFSCKLFTDLAPGTVANFVGLARGIRGFQDPHSARWVQRPFYDGLVFHRVIPGFMIQGGCPLGNGSAGPGYTIADEPDLRVRFDRGGLLAMANSGPNTNGSQFFITEQATAWLNDRHTIFGECGPLELVKTITAHGSQPPVKILAVSFTRQ